MRFIGDAGERIREDYLRILRFFRFTAAYGEGPPDRPGLDACVRERAGLAVLSGERMCQEMLRLLAAPRGPELIAAMLDYGLIVPVLGLAPRPAVLARLAAIQADLALEPDALLRLAALAVEVREDAERLRDRLRLSNEDTARLVRASTHAPAIGPGAPESAARAYLYAHGEAGYREQILLAWARPVKRPQAAPGASGLRCPNGGRSPGFPSAAQT